MSTEQSENLVYTQEIAKQLGETDEKPIKQIELIVQHKGREWVQELVDETDKIEADGGMKTDDSTRKRTKGGVFFYLAKGKLDDETRSIIFPQFGQKGKVVEWEDRHEYVDTLMDANDHGNMRYVSITLHGRPGKIIEEDNTIITTISHIHKQTPLPKGVPHPPDIATVYTVYMSRKQWREVEPAIKDNKNDRLIVEGTIFLDQETDTIAVHATRITSRQLEKEANRDSDNDGNNGSDEKPTIKSKLEKLHSAADRLRERIDEMEDKGQRGVNMTKQLLRNTERQIEALEKAQARDE